MFLELYWNLYIIADFQLIIHFVMLMHPLNLIQLFHCKDHPSPYLMVGKHK